MSILAKPTNDRLAEKRALLSSVRERIRWLQEEVRAHGNAGRLDRRSALLPELRSLERRAESLNREIKRADNPAFASKFYSASVDR